MHRLPFGEVVLPVAAARPFLVFFGKMRVQRSVALRADGGGERVIVGLGVVADHLDLLLDEPFAGRRHEAGRAAEIVLAVFVELVPAGVDDHHVARPHDLAAGFLEVVAGDRFPFVLGDRHHDAGAEKMRQRHFVDERRALDHVRRRVDMRGVVHRGGDALRQHARLRHVVNALDLDVLEIRPVRRLIAEAMGQVVELQPHAVLEVFFKHHAANSFGHGILPCLLSSELSLQPNSGGGGIHMRLHGAFGGEQPFGDQRLPVAKALARHRH